MTEPKITKTHGAFSMQCRVEIHIQADAEIVWNLLTDAANFPRWNSTVSKVEGQIREGEHLRLHVPGTDRTFTPKVSGVVPNQRMTWTGGFAPLFKGIRTFELRRSNGNSTDFAMDERFEGLMLPFVRKSMPDFGPIFARYANDLKSEAEPIAALTTQRVGSLR
jgi:hypothetical protein